MEKALLLEKARTNDIVNIKVSDERLRQIYLDEAKQKIKLFELAVKVIKEFLPELIHKCPGFIHQLLDNSILHKEDVAEKQNRNRHNGR